MGKDSLSGPKVGKLEEVARRLGELSSLSVLSALVKIGRRVEEGFEGEITLHVHRGGVSKVQWCEVEMGDKIKEELRGGDL